MTQIVQGPEVGRWVAQKMHGHYWAEMSSAIGIEKEGEITAGVIYENWNQRSVTCHIAVNGRLSKDYIKAIFDYPYNKLNVEKILAPVASTNPKSRKLVENMGFRIEARIKDAHKDGDILIYTLKRCDCRFIGEKA